MAYEFQITDSVLLISSTLVILVLLNIIYPAATSPLRDIPGPWLARFTRLWLFRALSSRSYEEINLRLHQIHGRIVRIGPNEYSIDDPEAAKIIYRARNQLVKSSWYTAWGPLDGETNMFATLDLGHHARRRREVSSMYNMTNLTNIEYRVDNVSKVFFEKMGSLAGSNETVDIADWLQLYAFDAICSLTFGKLFGFVHNERDVAGLIAAVQGYARYGSIVGVFSGWHSTISRFLGIISPGTRVGLVALGDFAATALANNDPKDAKYSQNVESDETQVLESDFVSFLNARCRKYPEFKRDDVFYHLIPLVAAGAETTGSTMTAAVFFLCKYRPVLAKLRKELEIFETTRKPGTLIQLRETQDLPYLQAVLKETLRMYPAVGFGLQRVVSKGGLVLSGQFFPEGTIVGVNAWVAHANRAFFGPDADTFRPERWLEDPEASNKMDQYLLTFGRGPRVCIGKTIALMELGKVIPEMVLRYDFSLADPHHEMRVYNDWFVRPVDLQIQICTRKRGSPCQGSTDARYKVA